MRCLHRIAVLVLATTTGLSSAAAQTFDDAVRANLGLGLEICVRNMPSVPHARAALEAAEFSYTAEDFGQEIMHWYSAPAGTADVAVYEGLMSTDCRVETDHLGVSEALAFVGAALEQRFPGMFTYGNMENTPPVTAQNMGDRWLPCTGYVGWADQRPIMISVANRGNDPACVEDGTAHIVVTP